MLHDPPPTNINRFYDEDVVSSFLNIPFTIFFLHSLKESQMHKEDGNNSSKLSFATVFPRLERALQLANKLRSK